MINLDNLFKRMSELGLNARNVADATGISAGNITEWKKGRVLPTATKLDVLATFLDCSVDYLLGRSDIVRPTKLPNEVVEKILGFDNDFIHEKDIISPPYMSNRIYFVSRDNFFLYIMKIYEIAKKFDDSIMDKESFVSLFKEHNDFISELANSSGYSLTPKNYFEFHKIYNVYVDYYISKMIQRLEKNANNTDI